jgi:hypothetical protein
METLDNPAFKGKRLVREVPALVQELSPPPKVSHMDSTSRTETMKYRGAKNKESASGCWLGFQGSVPGDVASFQGCRAGTFETRNTGGVLGGRRPAASRASWQRTAFLHDIYVRIAAR